MATNNYQPIYQIKLITITIISIIVINDNDDDDYHD